MQMARWDAEIQGAFRRGESATTLTARIGCGGPECGAVLALNRTRPPGATCYHAVRRSYLVGSECANWQPVDQGGKRRLVEGSRMADKSLPNGDLHPARAENDRRDDDRRAFLRRAAIGLPVVLGTVPGRTVWAQGTASCRPSMPGFYETGVCL
jgi:hypothetical protein